MNPDVLILGSDDPLSNEPGGWHTLVRTFLERCATPSRYALAAPSSGRPGEWAERTVGDRTVRHLRLGGGSGLRWRSRRVGTLVMVVRLRRRLGQFGTIYSHGPELLLPFILGRYRGRLVLHVIGDLRNEARHARNPVFRLVAGPYRRLSLWVMGRCDRVLWVDRTQIAALPKSVVDRSEVLSTFYDPRLFYPRPEPRRPTACPLLVSVSRLTPVKRVDLVIRALALAAGNGENWRLAVCGRGAEEPELRRLAHEFGVADRVTWHTEHLEHAELASLLRQADAGVLVSRTEGSPAVVKEMLASGLPVVVSDVGDNRTLVRDGANGVLLRTVDERTVYEGVRRALSLGDGAPAAAVASVAPFTVDRWVERLESLLAG